eukprot:TRINITY_DN7382_c0_g1_i3.p1 TRINITY_DN7382_c0_g1~~TRINITY_DN7382_c0_g1_i3.p1  ORF type:complete len:520 (-),score=175.72 TRINITY_DN7382_c0_g1_i3:54-1613(-)
MQAIFHKIGNALSLDDSNNTKEAYVEYLSCIRMIVDLLLSNKDSISIVNSTKLFSLLEQCSSRAKEIAIPKPNPPPPSHNNNSHNNDLNQSLLSSSQSSSSENQHKALNESNNNSNNNNAEMNSPSMKREDASNLNEPFRRAEIENEKLLKMHEMKVNRLMQSLIPPQQMQQEIAQLNLTLARQRTENYRIAKDEHNYTLKKQFEKEQKSQQPQGNTSSSNLHSSHLPHFNIAIPRLVLQNSILSGLAKSLAEKSELKTADKNFRHRIYEGGIDKGEIVGYLSGILSNPSHPMGKNVIEFVVSWKVESTKDIAPFHDLKVKLKDFIASMSNSIVNHFKELDFLIGHEAEISTHDDLVELFISPIVTNVVFPPIYGNLFELYKMRFGDKDKSYYEKLKTFQFVSPRQLGVDRDLCLSDDDGIEVREELDPYRDAILKARSLTLLHTPSTKLDCLSQVNHIICEKVKNYYNGDFSFLGADQLLPLMCYVMVKANVLNIQSELSLLMDFTPDYDMLGERGYT